MTAAILGMSREFSPPPPPLRSVRDSGSRFPVCNSGGAARGAVAGDEEKEQGLEMRLELEEEGYKIPLPLSIGISPSKIINSSIILKLTFLESTCIPCQVRPTSVQIHEGKSDFWCQVWLEALTPLPLCHAGCHSVVATAVNGRYIPLRLARCRFSQES